MLVNWVRASKSARPRSSSCAFICWLRRTCLSEASWSCATFARRSAISGSTVGVGVGEGGGAAATTATVTGAAAGAAIGAVTSTGAGASVGAAAGVEAGAGATPGIRATGATMPRVERASLRRCWASARSEGLILAVIESSSLLVLPCSAASVSQTKASLRSVCTPRP